MRKVKCYECGKRYDFDADDFCPKCGAFTQPPRTSRIGVDGSVIRIDGINEATHQNSFVHAELHRENQKRKGSLLEGISAALTNSGWGERLPGPQVLKYGAGGSAMPKIMDFLNDILE